MIPNLTTPFASASSSRQASWSADDQFLFDRVWTLLQAEQADPEILDLRERLLFRHAPQLVSSELENRTEQASSAPHEDVFRAATLAGFQSQQVPAGISDLDRLAAWLRASCRWFATDRAASVLGRLPPQDPPTMVHSRPERSLRLEEVSSPSASSSPASMPASPAPSPLSRARPGSVERREDPPQRLTPLSIRRPQPHAQSQSQPASPLASAGHAGRKTPSSPQTKSQASPKASGSGSRQPLLPSFGELLAQMREAEDLRGEDWKQALKDIAQALHQKRPTHEQVIDTIRALGRRPELQKAVLRLVLEALPAGDPQVWTDLWEAVVHRLPHPEQRPLLAGLASQLLSRKLQPTLESGLMQWMMQGPAEPDTARRFLRLGQWHHDWLELATAEVRDAADGVLVRKWLEHPKMQPAERNELLIALITRSVARQPLDGALVAELADLIARFGDAQALQQGLSILLVATERQPELLGRVLRITRVLCTHPDKAQSWMRALADSELDIQMLARGMAQLERPLSPDLWENFLHVTDLSLEVPATAWKLFFSVVEQALSGSQRSRHDLRQLVKTLFQGAPHELPRFSMALQALPADLAVDLFDMLECPAADSLTMVEKQTLAPVLVRRMGMEALEQLLAPTGPQSWRQWFFMEAPPELVNQLFERWSAFVQEQPDCPTRALVEVFLHDSARHLSSHAAIRPSIAWWMGRFLPQEMVETGDTNGIIRQTLIAFKALEELQRPDQEASELWVVREWCNHIQNEHMPAAVFLPIEGWLGEIRAAQADPGLMKQLGKALSRQMLGMLNRGRELLENDVRAGTSRHPARMNTLVHPMWSRFWRLVFVCPEASVDAIEDCRQWTTQVHGALTVGLQAGLTVGLTQVAGWLTMPPTIGIPIIRLLAFSHGPTFPMRGFTREFFTRLTIWLFSQEPQYMQAGLAAVLLWIDGISLPLAEEPLEYSQMVNAMQRLLLVAMQVTPESAPEIRFWRQNMAPVLSLVVGALGPSTSSESTRSLFPLLNDMANGVYGESYTQAAELQMSRLLLGWNQLTDSRDCLIQDLMLPQPSRDGEGNQTGMFAALRKELLRAMATLDRQECSQHSQLAVTAMLAHTLKAQITKNGPHGIWEALGGPVSYRLVMLARSFDHLNTFLTPHEFGAGMPSVLGVDVLRDLPRDRREIRDIAQQCFVLAPTGTALLCLQMLFWRAALNAIHPDQATVEDSVRVVEFIVAMLECDRPSQVLDFLTDWLDTPSLLTLDTLQRAGLLRFESDSKRR
jgi:hypothetical protein